MVSIHSVFALCIYLCIYKYSPQRKVSSRNRIKEAPPYRARDSFSFSSKEVNAFVFLLLQSLLRIKIIQRASNALEEEFVAFCGCVKLKKEYPLRT